MKVQTDCLLIVVKVIGKPFSVFRRFEHVFFSPTESKKKKTKHFFIHHFL